LSVVKFIFIRTYSIVDSIHCYVVFKDIFQNFLIHILLTITPIEYKKVQFEKVAFTRRYWMIKRKDKKSDRNRKLLLFRKIPIDKTVLLTMAI